MGKETFIQEFQKEFQQLSVQDLKEIFGYTTIKEVFEDKIIYYSDLYGQSKYNLDKAIADNVLKKGLEKTNTEFCITIYREHCDYYKNKVGYWDFKLKQLNSKKLAKEQAQKIIDKMRLKELPILDVAQRLGINIDKKVGNNNYCKIRNEKTPSCCINTQRNTWHDFGSGKGGDNIDLWTEINQCDFYTALKEMNEIF